MPRIDPIQLLNCLSVLLSPSGGIKSRDEVQRLAHLMTKFSKKLVSKCIYIQILKCTESELLGLFLGSGGWRLAHVWLTESIAAKNWPLVRELLELLLLCPVDIELLKTNNCPKLVKELSKDGNDFAIRALASKLVDQWLKTVKGEQFVPILESDIKQIIANAQKEIEVVEIKKEENSEADIFNKIKSEVEQSVNNEKDKIEIEVKCELKNTTKECEPLPVLKISMKDGAQIISQVGDDDKKSQDKEKHKDKSKSKSKDKSHDRSSSSSKPSSSKSSSKSHSSSNDKHKSSHRSSSPSRNSSSKDKSKDKDGHLSSSKSRESSSSKKPNEKSSSSNKSKDDKISKTSSDKDKNKDKPKDDKVDKKQAANDEKPSIHKLGKIPKLSDSKKDKPTISIEVRKPDEPKPKTVKTFNSKFRKHGLEEEVRPPPSRASVLSKKPPPAATPLPAPAPAKRVSDVAGHDTPPEKKPKPEPVEKPGSIKLIPPKPKPMLLLESDMFMDALTASATNKKEPKKRKRRISGSRDSHSPPHTSPPAEHKSVPPRFYQDTLETDDKEKSPKSPEKEDEVKDSPKEEASQSPKHETPVTSTVNGMKGVLCYHKKKGPKKSIKWKPDSELEEIQYFELDETERVNVTKTFTDMKHLERLHEKEAFQKARNLSVDDVMEERTHWRPLMLVQPTGQVEVEWGKKSRERDIQAARQVATLQPLYFSKAMIPDSPLEPDPETHVYAEPTIIPLEDVTGNQDNVSDFRNMPWPEPKGNAPPSSAQPPAPPQLFPGQFPNGFPPAIPPGMPPGFPPAPAMMPGDWSVMPVPGMMMPDVMMPGADMFPPQGMFPMPGMFPPDFAMGGPGPQGLPGPGQEGFDGPEVFPNTGNFRGGMRGRGGGWRGKGQSWEGPPRGGRGGGPQRGGRRNVCIYFQKKGSCRQGDKCTFLHPGVNGPY